MLRTWRILPLATALFAFTVPVWAVEAKTTAIDVNGAPTVGNPLSGGGALTGQPQPVLATPGLLPSLQAPLGAPAVQESKSPALAQPLKAPQDSPSIITPPSLPQSALEVPDAAQPAPGPTESAQAPSPAAPAGEASAGPVSEKHPDQPRGPPGEEPALIKRARRYIRDIMGSRAPTEAETEVLLQDYMEAEGIEPASDSGLALRSGLLASKIMAEAEAVAKLGPRYRDVGPFILAAAKEYGVAPAQVTAAVEKRGLAGLLAKAKSKEQADRILDSVLARDRFDRLLARYPKNRQGDLMRDVASNMLVRSGKSIEEVSRDGVFVYADFHGRSLTNASVGRDPDPQTPNVLFYVRFEDDRWRIDVYRQNHGRGFQGGSDASFVEAFRHWLIVGGVPRGDFLSE